MSGLGCSIDIDGTTAVIAGDVDHYSAPEFHPRLRDFGAQGGNLIVDLRGVRFIDSTGVSALILLRQQVVASGGTVLVLPSQNVKRVVELLGVGDVLLR